MTKPISPGEVGAAKAHKIPGLVVEAFNDLIVREWTGSRSVILQKDIADAIVKKLVEAGAYVADVARKKIYDEHWLDVEPIFEAAGWDVYYEKPVYYAGEDFEPRFTFTRKGSR